jgi:hypothetical protein
MKNSKRSLLLAMLSLLMGAGFSGVTLKVFGMLETRTWFVEGNKPNQASIWGRQPNAYFGNTLAVGDVNGDGFEDLIVSAHLVETDVQAGGEVYVVPGPLSFNGVYTMPLQAAIIFQGISEHQPQIGMYLDSGDMNGDGIDDIVMGSWILNKAYVYLGSPEIQASSPVTIAATSENMALTIYPANSGVIMCDFNADGYADLFGKNSAFPEDGGYQVWGVLGSSALTSTQPITRVLPAEADIAIQGFLGLGWGLPGKKNAACGDVDGDSIPDLAIGTPGETSGVRANAGVVYVVGGSADFGSGISVTLNMPEQADAIIDGVDGYDATRGDYFGYVVESADVNLDGRADLIVGAPGAWGPQNHIGFAGEVYLWLGRALAGQRFFISNQAAWTVYGNTTYDNLGMAIATGDFDNDGYPEILLGCAACADPPQPPFQEARSYVLEPLQISGKVAVSTVSRLDIVPYRFSTCLGTSVAAMDLNGDNVSDLVISAPCTDQPEGNIPGTVYVISYPDHFRSFLPVVHK